MLCFKSFPTSDPTWDFQSIDLQSCFFVKSSESVVHMAWDGEHPAKTCSVFCKSVVVMEVGDG